MSLFDDNLKTLINAAAKIFPVNYSYVTENMNPNNYEWVRIIDGEHRKEIYHWENGIFELIGADDKEVDFETDVVNKPLNYPPSEHIHDNDHSHDNKSLLDTITQMLIDKWNTVTSKANTIHSHDDLYYTENEIDTKLSSKSDNTHNHDGVYQPAGEYSLAGHKHVETDITGLDKYTKIETDNLLANKAALSHDHDGRYYTESEVDTKLGQKASLVHTHDYAANNHNHDTAYAAKVTEATVSDHETRLFNIENGYSEGHVHSNLSVLDIITQALIDTWNSAVNHISDVIKHITADERTLWNTVSNKAESNHNHDTIYSALEHIHDDKYYTETEIDTKLSSKSDITHTHTDKADKTYVDTELAKKADSTTVSGHTGNSTIHVTSTDKNNWNSKTKIIQGTVKPETDTVFWFKEV